MNDKHEGVPDEILNTESGLTEWELYFIESLDKQRERSLSVSQADELADIWHKVFGWMG